MSQTYPTGWRNCATCAYWSGEREIDFGVTRVILNGSSEGKCLCRRSGFMLRERSAASSCNYYIKWIPLTQ